MVTKEMKEFVKQGNVAEIRRELLAILNTNPDMSNGQFKENLKYAVDRLGKETVFAAYSGEFEMKEREQEWTTSYVAKIYLQLRKEFSYELIEHLTKVAPVAYREKVTQRELLQQTAQKTGKLTETTEAENNNFREVCRTIVKWVLIAVIAGVLVMFGVNIG